MYTTIIFDFDGTLAPSLELWMKAFQHAFRSQNLELTDPHLFIKYFYQPLPITAAECGITSIPEYIKQVEKGYFEAFKAIRLFPQVPELLANCKLAGLATALVTSTPRPWIDATLEKLGLTNAFDTIVTSSEVKAPKPHPESLLLALQRLGKKPQESLAIGDSIGDILAGKAAATATALYLPEQNARFYNFDELRATQPDFIFSQYEQLLEYLGLPKLQAGV
jgi:pyrophosphatase PpaX